MALEELKKNEFKREYRPLNNNPIRQIDHPDYERTFLGETDVKSNIIVTDDERILGMFCYDAK